MTGKRYSPEQITSMLREAEVIQNKKASVKLLDALFYCLSIRTGFPSPSLSRGFICEAPSPTTR